MKRVFASFGFGLLLFATWVCIIIFTSQDFVHEGPNSAWFAPIDWWAGVIQQTPLARPLASGKSPIYLMVGFAVLAAPFIALFSLVSFCALQLLKSSRKKR